jgi:hypothetical protein
MTAAITIDYQTTTDMDDGQPLPPFIDDDGAVWRVTRRLPDARTCWCRIRLAEQTNDTKIHAQDKAKAKEI